MLHRPIRALAGLLCLLLAACDSGRPADPQADPPLVEIRRLTPAEVVMRETYPGRARGAREVQVRSRVEGILQSRGYTEGQRVEEGADLFIIDPEPFEVALQQAQAALENAEARARQAAREWEQVRTLHQRGVISTLQRDRKLSELELARADVARAKAAVAQARIDLGYTRVRAPLTGVTSLEVLDPGSLVQPGDLLTTLTELDPVHVYFSLPEQDPLARRTASRVLGADEDRLRRTATLILPDGSHHPQPGAVDFTESSIDPHTGTVRARAVFSNPQGSIRPGQFVRVELVAHRLQRALTVPPGAVTEGAEGPIVFVVDDQDKAQARPVVLGPSNARLQVLEDGVAAGDRVIVQGIAKVRSGTPVKIRQAVADQGAAATGATARAGGAPAGARG